MVRDGYREKKNIIPPIYGDELGMLYDWVYHITILWPRTIPKNSPRPPKKEHISQMFSSKTQMGVFQNGYHRIVHYKTS